MIRSYQDAIDYIYSFINPGRRPASSAIEAQRNVDRMAALLDAVGHPQASLPAVLVAGTKGKGSVCAMVEAIARAAGLRTGLWTSPHLSSYRERIQIDRQPISQIELVDLVNRLAPQIDRFAAGEWGRPSTFDVGFALALVYFATHKVQLAVIEVGMGGRYDSTNAITPLVSGITSISHDHVHVLGSTLIEIAGNKAGIIKPGVPTVTIPHTASVAEVIETEAAHTAAPLYIASHSRLTLVEAPHGGDWPASMPLPVRAQSALGGSFQRENASIAIGIALLLRGCGLPLSDPVIAAGLAAVRWPGRFELVPGEPSILIDGAHNGDSARKLYAAIRSELRYDRFILVLGTSRDKDIEAIASELVPHAQAVVITRSHHTRALPINDLLNHTTPHLCGTLVITANVAEAVQSARALARPEDLICITGSLFVAAAAREALGLALPD
jgi:dihydrofolate synthase/folylpolyglutamate synthase